MNNLEKCFGVMGLESNSTLQEIKDKYNKLKNQFTSQANSENLDVANYAKQKIEKLETVYKSIMENISPDLNKCELCNSGFDRKLYRHSPRVPSEIINLINSIADSDLQEVCRDCFARIYDKELGKIKELQNKINIEIQECVNSFPIVTTHNPLLWKYRTIGIVTGQTTTGTGFFAEFESSFADFFGGQSSTLNNKLSNGEQKCFMQLRLKAYLAGGNAILATDIDYSEVGGQKGMLMVCASGTAVCVENIDVLGEGVESKLNKLCTLKSDLENIISCKETYDEKIGPFLNNTK